MRATLGSPIAFSFLELPDDLLEGDVLEAFAGDVPNFYYTCRIPDDISAYFGFPDLAPADLEDAVTAELGTRFVLPGEGEELALAVLGMGWSWARVLAQFILEGIFDSERVPLCQPDMRVSDVAKTPIMAASGDVVH